MSNRLTSRRVSRLSSRVRARLVGFEKHPDWLKGADSTSVAAHARIASGGRVRGAANGAPFSSGASCENRSPVFALLSTADGIVRGVVRAVFAFVRRQDGGSPCNGRGRRLCHKTCRLGNTQREVHVLDGCARGALPEVVEA